MYLHKIRTIHGVTRVLVFLLGSLWMKHGMVPLSIKKKKEKKMKTKLFQCRALATWQRIITQEATATFPGPKPISMDRHKH